MGVFNNEKVTVTATAPAGRRDIMVDSRVIGNNQNVTLQWRVRMFDGEPKIIDVKVEGVSLAVTTREDFAGIVQQRGMDGLIDALKTKTAEMKAKAASEAATGS